MALVRADPFAFYDTSQILRAWSTSTATVEIGAHGPNGSGAARFSAALPANLESSGLTTSGSTHIIGFDLRFSAAPSAVNTLCNVLDSGTVHVGIFMDTDRKIRAYRGNGVTLLGTSSDALSVNTWYHINVKVVIHDSSGSVTVNVHDGTSSTAYLTLTGIDTQDTANATWNHYSIGGVTDSGTTDIANLVVQDGSGGLNDLLGPVDVNGLYADARSTPTLNDFTLSAGSDVSALLDETPADDDTTYVNSSTQDHQQSVFVDLLPYADRDVHGMQSYLCAREESGAPAIAPLTKQSGTVRVGSATTLGASYAYVTQPYSAMPDGSVPTYSAFNALEWGAKLTTSGDPARITQIAVAVVVARTATSRRHLLVGLDHTVEGSDLMAVGRTSEITGSVAETHGVDTTVDGDYSILTNLTSTPRTLTGDRKWHLYADEILLNGVAPGAWKPLTLGTEPLVFVSDGAGDVVMVAFTP